MSRAEESNTNKQIGHMRSNSTKTTSFRLSFDWFFVLQTMLSRVNLLRPHSLEHLGNELLQHQRRNVNNEYRMQVNLIISSSDWRLKKSTDVRAMLWGWGWTSSINHLQHGAEQMALAESIIFFSIGLFDVGRAKHKRSLNERKLAPTLVMVQCVFLFHMNRASVPTSDSKWNAMVITHNP